MQKVWENWIDEMLDNSAIGFQAMNKICKPITAFFISTVKWVILVAVSVPFFLFLLIPATVGFIVKKVTTK